MTSLADLEGLACDFQGQGSTTTVTVAASGLVSITCPDPDRDEKQRLAFSNVTGGSFTLTFDGETTGPILCLPNVQPTNADLRGALETLSNIGPGEVVVTGQPCVEQFIEFEGIYASVNVPQLAGNAAGLTGTAPTLQISTVRQGRP